MATTNEPEITMDTIRQCASIICQYMNRESIYPYLLQYALLTDDESYHFMSKDKSPGESGGYLIGLLEKKDSGAQIFYQCLQIELQHSGHLQIAECLRTTALQDTSCKEKLEEMNAISSKDESEKETDLVTPEELKEMVTEKKIIKEITPDSNGAKMCKQKTQILLVTANDFEQYAALSLLEPMEGSTTLLRFQHSYTGNLAKAATYTCGRFGAFDAAVQRMTTQGPAPAQDVIAFAADCFCHNLNAIFGVGVACGVKEKNNMLDVLVSKTVTFYDVARQGIIKGKSEMISRDIANLPTSDFLLQHFNNPPEWPTKKSKTVARLTTKKPKKCTGLLLSGSLLIDDKEFKEELLKNFAKEAIGIEMEGAGLYHDYRSHNYEILIVKAVCDFGDGKKNKDYQPTAALLAAECLHHYLSRDIMPQVLSEHKGKSSGRKPYSNPIGDDNREQDGKKHQIHQPRQYLQLQPQEQQAKKQNDENDERDGGTKRQEPVDVTHPQQNGGTVLLDMNNHGHHQMIIQLAEYLEGDNVDHRKLYRFFQLTDAEKSKVDDSKTGQIYETLSQYVETKKPTTTALIENLQKCKVTQEYIEFVANYKY